MNDEQTAGERIAELAEQLAAAARTVPDCRAYTDPGAAVQPPGVVVGPPRLTFEGYGGGPTTATFLLAVCVATGDRAMSKLFDLAPAVAAAVHTHVVDAAVTVAQPGVWESGSVKLPCYELTVETNL